MTEATHLRDVHAEARLKIDEEILLLTRRLLVLRSTRNTLAPISRLPPETMCAIFHQCTQGNILPGCTSVNLTISSVSRRWRDIALSLSPLWTTIKFAHPEGIQTFSVRAKNLPLTISLDFDYSPKHVAVIPYLLDLLPRTRSLNIDAYGEKDTDNGLRFPERDEWANAAPFLETLVLNGVPLPSPLFSGIPTRIEYLDLSYCQFTLNSFSFFEALTTLIISRPDTLVSASDVLQALRQAPNVEYIDLCAALSSPETFITASPVQLPTLSRIFIVEQAQGPLPYFLDQLDLPKYIKVDLDFESTSLLEDLVVLRRIVECFRLSSEGFTGFRIVIFSDSFTLQLNKDGQTKVDICFNASFPGEDYIVDLLEPLQETISNIESLDLAGYGDFLSLTDIFEKFSGFSSLTFLTVDSNFATPFFTYIAQQVQLMDREDGLDADEVAFPRLCELTFRGAFPTFPGDLFPLLNHWLRRRMELGYGLSILAFVHCPSVNGEVVARWGLEEYVEEVTIRDRPTMGVAALNLRPE
ncbi:hypothetical protein BDN72DRAFT_964137 [Pluteus cervinus]|uniref:Uncharacterized protein n=1 Tax=Pluteus cervinus TaxID=181527 RepID=A0ACD3ABJ1_9AGAR|nr:hypothetical protein BDN72DRAFT_964137 [Pluteus cervinus]